MFGSMANDGGHFFVDPAQHKQVENDPIIAKYLRLFVGARELIHGTERWCLWLDDIDLSDITKSAFIRDRVTVAMPILWSTILTDSFSR